MHDTQAPLWQPSPSRLAATHLTAFTRLARAHWGKALPDYDSLWQASVDDPAGFWSMVWDYCGVIGDKGTVALANATAMPGAKFFPDARLNYAENLLRGRGDATALTFLGENQLEERWSHDQLRAEVSRLQQAMRQLGVVKGDRIAGLMPNMPATLAAMLAATSLGAIWTSCSPDFGQDGAEDRFGQTTPRILFCPDGYWYNGKIIDIRDKMRALADSLLSVERIVVVPYIGKTAEFAAAIPRAVTLTDFLAPFTAQEPFFERVEFDHPLFILYSSGTTGKPKCIVHGTGGTLLQHLKEHQLHADLHQGDRFFYFTTCGWMMWNWLVTGLASGATLMLYDGSPFAAEGHILWDYAEDLSCTHFGTSAKYIDGLRKLGLEPKQHYRLDSLRTLFSTGSPLVPESFDWVYHAIKTDLNLASVSGGTDIVSCFALGCSNLPVWRGELQCRGLGMAVEVVDERGKPLRGAKGELVCTRPFPSMPVAFWNDTDGSRYHSAYFNRFDGIWCHGDFAEITEHGGVIIYGRSDAVLNPGGVRIGTAEIYRQVETFEEVLESLAVGQRWEDDERVILFVRLKAGVTLDEELSRQIRERIRNGTTPRHVPARVVQVSDIPRTLSGKIVELAVKNVIHGDPVHNLTALANPEALELFRNLPELQA